MPQKTTKSTARKTTASRSNKRITTSGGFFSKKRNLIFLAAFAVVGSIILATSFASTGTNIDPSDIAFAYTKNAPISVSRDPVTGKVSYQSIPQNYLVLSDGTLLCDNGNPDGTIATAKLSKSNFNSLSSDLNNLQIQNIPKTTASSTPITQVGDGEQFIVNRDTTTELTVPRGSTKPSKLAQMQDRIQNVCNNNATNNGSNRGQHPVFNYPKPKRSSAVNDQDLRSRIAEALMPKAEAVAPSPADPTPINAATDVSANQIAMINALRAQRGLYPLREMACLDNSAANQAYSMALTNKNLGVNDPRLSIFHSQNMSLSMGSSCASSGLRYNVNAPKDAATNNWTSFSENVGMGGSSDLLFNGNPGLNNGYVHSAEHLANILSTSARCIGEGTYYDTANHEYFNTMHISAWVGGVCQR